jgi:acetyl-CoA carboxylase biotin carboxyl carrier protein
MPDPESEPVGSPDVRTIRQLVKLMHRFDLTALDWTHEKSTIRLRRGRGVVSTAASPAPIYPVGSAPAPVVLQEPAPVPVAAASEKLVIRSPMVGTFYESASPDAKPYVAIGSSVRAETAVCLIEAMKVFTEINAGVSGTIVEILVKSGQPVEFDQPLFRVDPA